MNKKAFKVFETVGVFVIYLIAAGLHFVYDFSGQSALSILFGAVNESVWEHIKIFCAGYVIYAFLELLCIKNLPFKKFVVAKTAGLYFMSIFIIAYYYTYTFFTKKPILAVDLILSFAAVVLAQYISYNLTVKDINTENLFDISVMLIMLFFIMFFSFTVFPPKLGLFRDPNTNSYGVIDTYADAGAYYLDNIKLR